MKTLKRIVVLTITLITLFAVTSCNPNPGPEELGTEDPGTEEPGTESPGAEYAIKVHHTNMTVEVLEGGSHSVEADTRIEVRFIAQNIPTTIADEGTELVMAGAFLADSVVGIYDWKANSTDNTLVVDTSTEFVDSVENGTVNYIFYYDAGNAYTDFKIFFNNGTWTTALDDPEETGGNFKVVLDGFAEVGEVVTVTFDASVLAE